MRTFIFNKLVRDGIVGDIKQLGGTAEIQPLNDAGYVAKLLEKFQEELAEVSDSSVSEISGEIGDLYELLDCLAVAKGTTSEASHIAQAKRKAKMGGFSDRIYVKSITIPDDDPWSPYYAARSDRFPEVK
jgi:predicted house-cleaning noncanonical NTP pyrophosphatase (MazG superfamily)